MGCADVGGVVAGVSLRRLDFRHQCGILVFGCRIELKRYGGMSVAGVDGFRGYMMVSGAT